MYAALRQELKVVIQLAKERERLANADSPFDNPDNLLSVEIKNSPASAAKERLRKYLETLTFADVKAIQTIMYVGRDTIHEDLTADELYNEKYTELSWHKDKSIEIKQMVDKVPLGEYLERGATLLKIKV